MKQENDDATTPKTYLRVKNWETLQHYKDRNPPWIKLYNALLDDHAFAALADRDKGALILIWLLASRLKNYQIPFDPAWIRDRISWRRTPNLTSFIEEGFLIVCEPDENRTGSEREPDNNQHEPDSPIVENQRVPDEIASKALDQRQRQRKRKRKNTPLTPQRGKASVSKKRKPRLSNPPGFDSFWETYPKKKAKPRDIKAWLKVNPDADLQAVILRAVETEKGTRDWLKEGGKYVPHPASWLNDQRWEDEVENASIDAGGDHGDSKFDDIPTVCQ